MRALVIVLAALAVSACADAQVRSAASRTAAALPPRGHLTTRAHLFRGPRVMTAEHTHGRTLTMFGTARAASRLLVAGCANGTRCAGTDVVRAALIGCPPPDADLWYFASLDPGGADLDVVREHPGALAFHQAAADLRPTIAVIFRTGARSLVRGGAAARRYARLARLPYARETAETLAGTLPATAGVTVELPPGRASKRTAARLAYALDRLAGTRFAKGADYDRRRMIALGRDPRAQN